MPRDWTTRRMSDDHETMIEERTGAKRTKGSGNQFNGRTDNRHKLGDFLGTAYDGKSTFGKSLSITRDMIAKLRDQAGGLIPAMPIRFYRDEHLAVVDEDWIAIPFEHYVELRELAWMYEDLCR